ncbi:MAG: hypothetical protein R3E31_26750 [Chloroflexota bacterium]
MGRYYSARAREFGTTAAIIALVALFGLAFVGVSQTNVRVIQADVVFMGKPYDDQAARLSRNQQTLTEGAAAWDTIAIYEHALDLAPKEDFYYLFLGRAYLERSTIEAGHGRTGQSICCRRRTVAAGARGQSAQHRPCSQSGSFKHPAHQAGSG